MSIIQGNAKGAGVAGFYDHTIDQSLRFEDGDGAHLIRTPSTAGNQKTWTWSAWVKRGNISTSGAIVQTLFIRDGTSDSTYFTIRFRNTDELEVSIWNSAFRKTNRKFRDPSAWYHIVVAFDTTQTVANDRVKVWVNGEQETSFAVSNDPTLNADYAINLDATHILGEDVRQNAYNFDGYMAEVHFTDGTAYTADDFGELKSGIWIPKDPSVTYGTNGFHLDFADSADIGNDVSGEANDFTVTNLVASDVVPDSPTNNFATYNPLHSGGSLTKKEGNLSITAPGNNWYTALVTQGIDSGKWYAEFYYKRASGYAFIGVAKIAQPITINAYLGESSIGDSDSYGYYSLNGYVFNQGVQTAYGDTYTDGDVIGLAIDMDAGDLYFYKNGVAQNSGTAAATGLTGTMYIGATSYSPNSTVLLNCGQDSTFAGNTTAGGNTDDNGIGNFKYAPPSGYLALCNSNLPDPVIDPAQDMYAGNHFDIVTYVGNGGSQLIGDVVREVPDTYPISQSLRFNDDDTAYLTLSSGSKGTSTNADKCTISVWLKRGNTGSYQTFMFGGTSTNNTILQFTDVGQIYFSQEAGGSKRGRVSTSQYFNDTSSWYHIVFAYDASLGTAADRAKLWVNGVSVEFTNQTDAIDSGRDNYWFSDSYNSYIGYDNNSTAHKFDGYMAEYHGIDGTAYEASDFGAFDGDGLWYPITPSVTYGTNGFYLDFADGSALGDDESGNTNDWTPTNFASTDVVLDTPTNSICTLDPTSSVASGGTALSEGNLYFGDTSSSGASWYKGTQQVKSGKWYFEGLNVAQINGLYLGWQQYDGTPVVGVTQTGTAVYMQSGYSTILYTDQSSQNNSISGSPSANTTGDVYQVAIDVDTGKVWFGVNNTWAGDPAAGTGYAAVLSDATKGVKPLLGAIGGGSYQYIHLNFGQDSTFSGAKTAGGNTDGNSVGDFQYAPPTGFLALAENNITNDTTNVESPDLVWFKSRDVTHYHLLVDSVRGGYLGLTSNATDAEAAVNGIQFVKNGVVITHDSSWNTINSSGSDKVAWMWKGGTQASNTNGTITSTVSANTDAGFSIVGYTGNNTAGATVGHGLSSAPEMIIVKNRGAADGWLVYHKGVASDAETDYLGLNTTNNAIDSTVMWNDTAPASSVFTLGNYGGINNSIYDYIAYCFHSVDGFSKVGSYKGNGNANGSFVYTGFRPKWLMVKMSSAAGGSWVLVDAERDPYNVTDEGLFANSTASTNIGYAFDFTSNGFKARSTSGQFNANNYTYVYLAFAEQPFKYSNAR
ncbi:MAG: LamG-like jellyroll fold domain-containing protein [Candidatus Poseidoniales archaeon]